MSSTEFLLRFAKHSATLPKVLGRPLGCLEFSLVGFVLEDPIQEYFSEGFKGHPSVGGDLPQRLGPSRSIPKVQS